MRAFDLDNEITPMSRDLALRIDRLVEGVVVDPKEPLGEESLLDEDLGDDGLRID